MAWAILIVAGFFEVAWAIGLKYTEGFTRLWPSAWVVATLWPSASGCSALPCDRFRSAPPTASGSEAQKGDSEHAGCNAGYYTAFSRRNIDVQRLLCHDFDNHLARVEFRVLGKAR
jgi:hypothetical protein